MVKDQDPRPTPSDPVELLIQQEIEEFLRDLTLEFPFPDIFETLRRYEFKDRFGAKIKPLPSKRASENQMKEIQARLNDFLDRLFQTFGNKYKSQIEEGLRYYTQTTVD